MILADEPTGNLDERTRDEIIALLEELWREHAQTIVMVTHDTQMAARASRRLWLDAGAVVSSEGRFREDVALVAEPPVAEPLVARVGS